MAKEETPQETAPESFDIKIDPEKALAPVENTLEKFLETAHVNRVYGEPIRRGDVTIIPAAEVLVGLGFGLGMGAGSGPDEDQEGEGEVSQGFGGGGGGGGRTLSRPAAVIVISPEGVHVEPVVDATKVAIAGITASGLMMATLLGILNPRNFFKRLQGE